MGYIIRQIIGNLSDSLVLQLLIAVAGAACALSFRSTRDMRVAVMGAVFCATLVAHSIFRYTNIKKSTSEFLTWMFLLTTERALMVLSVVVIAISLYVLVRYIAPRKPNGRG